MDRRTVLVLVIAFILGVFIGYCGSCYYFEAARVKQIAEQAQNVAEKQQEALSNAVKAGKVEAVGVDSVTVNGKTYRINEYSTVQVGMNFVSRPGEKCDLTKYFKVGDNVKLVEKGGVIAALYRELRPGERS